MERYRFTRRISLALKQGGVIKVLHRISEVVDTKTLQEEQQKFNAYYDIHEAEYNRVLTILDDHLSRDTYQAIVEYMRGIDLKKVQHCLRLPQYFQKDICKLGEDTVFIDGGAYVGDTIEEFVKYTNGKFGKIYAWEPDQENLVSLSKMAQKEKRIHIVRKGLWNKEETLCFSENATDKSKIDETGNSTIPVSAIDMEHKDEKISFIKMDIEGAEMNALSGAKNTILKNKPLLAICIYHSYEDYYRIPLWIKELVPEYHIYVRAHSDSPGEAVVYAVI